MPVDGTINRVRIFKRQILKGSCYNLLSAIFIIASHCFFFYFGCNMLIKPVPKYLHSFRTLKRNIKTILDLNDIKSHHVQVDSPSRTFA